jgi:NTE family protein
MWLRKTNSSGSSATRDDRTPQEPVPQQAASDRSGASALLLAAQIWSTEADGVSSAPEISELVAPLSAPPPAPKASQPRVSQPETAPVVAEMILAATRTVTATTGLKPSAVKVSMASERSFAETVGATMSTPPRFWPPRKLSLALQGGGSFSAFGWGVLERLLDEPACDFDTISGASAGAINAALLACGLAEGGREGARRRLSQFWHRIISEASFRSQMVLGGFSPASSSVSFGPALRSGWFDPLDLDPLRDLLSVKIDFEAVQSEAAPRLLIAATRVRDGQLRIFRNSEITPDVLLASTCPPQLHGAVEIDGDVYWDGGYGANPPIIGVVHESSAADLLVVQVTPTRDPYIPVTSAAIDRRLDQITANAVLNAEIAALEWARSDGLHPPRIHRLAAEDEIEGLAQRSSADLGTKFLMTLHERGRDAADRWLHQAPNGTTLSIQERRPAFPLDASVLDALLA